MPGSKSDERREFDKHHFSNYTRYAYSAQTVPWHRPIPGWASVQSRAVIVSADPLFSTNRSRLADLAVKNRLPSMVADQLYVEGGALVSYGPSYRFLYHHAASYVDKILKGAKPGDLPIEQPKVFELVINRKTAEALGLKLPAAVLARADRVIV